jgi:hypothetical protein
MAGITDICRSTAVGGWVEYQDWDTSPKPAGEPFPSDCQLVLMADHMVEACEKCGREPSPGPKLEGWIRDAGFTDIRSIKIPCCLIKSM